ncbi:MAG TPA: hypothetical protein VLB72_10530 [Burkholderiales bacterium]|nr:hypothetical protein [Burkholderiales bacterium]HXV09536.1 hypothetical protein [Burkholderiales bacterium]
MNRFAISLAGPDDDAQLRARMAQDRMDGAIAVSFRREPSYFAGCPLQGDATQVVKCTDHATGTIIGLGSRSTLLAWVDGELRRIGYLSDLRLAPEYRGGPLLARGYRFFRKLHLTDRVPFYTTVIYEGNGPALEALVGGRAGLPLYRDWGRLLTPAIRLDLPVRQTMAPGVEIERGSGTRLPEIVSFLNRWQRQKQFSPHYREVDFGGGRFAGLTPEDFFLALRRGRIVGTVAAWDQAALRQAHVERYSGMVRWLRPAYNALTRLTPLKPLPGPGARIPFVYLACLAVEGNDVETFRHLLRIAHEYVRRGRWHYAIAGLHESDPLAEVLSEFRAIPAAGRMFVAHFPDEPLAVEAATRRIPYLEAGCL